MHVQSVGPVTGKGAQSQHNDARSATVRAKRVTDWLECATGAKLDVLQARAAQREATEGSWQADGPSVLHPLYGPIFAIFAKINQFSSSPAKEAES